MPDRPQSRTARPRHRRGRRHGGVTERPATTLHSPSTQIVITPKTVSTPPKETTADFSYVTRDLKNIAMIIGGIVVAFIVLYFVWK